jgi:hypothetical protein
MPSLERTPLSGRYPKGGWRARYRDPQGKSQRQTFPARAAAQRFLERNGTSIQRAEWIDPELRRTRFEYWSDLWWATTVHLRPTTRHGYGGALRARVLPAFEGRRIAEIDRAVVRKWIAEISAAGYAPKSMRQAVSVLSMIMQLAQESGAVLSNPAQRHRLPRVMREEPVFLTAAQVETLAASVRTPYGFLVRFAAYTDLRPSELCGLRVGRLDVLRGTVEVAETLIPCTANSLSGRRRTTRVALCRSPGSSVTPPPPISPRARPSSAVRCYPPTTSSAVCAMVRSTATACTNAYYSQAWPPSACHVRCARTIFVTRARRC